MEKTDRIERLLIVRNDRIGDLLLTLPAIEAARRALPDAHIAALVSPLAAPLLDRNHDLDEVLVDDAKQSAWRLSRKLRQQRFDAALVVNTNSRNCLAVFLAGIGQRVGWAGKPAGMLLANRRLHLHRSRPPIHEADFALAFIDKLGLPAQRDEMPPRLDVDLLTRRRVTARIHAEMGDAGPLFGVHPGSNNSAFNWPLENYIQLIDRLAEQGRVMVTGSRDEAPLLREIRLQLAERDQKRIGFFTDLTLPELAAAVSLQDVLTVSSTGPMHLAGVLGTAVVALFSSHPAQVPEKWAPLGPYQTILQAPLLPGEPPKIPASAGEAHMSRITVEQVLAANLASVERVSVLVA